MTTRGLVRAWNVFFFQPQLPTPVALYRILYGLLVIDNLVLLRPDWLTWYGPHAITSLDTMRRASPARGLNLVALLPQTDFAVNAFFWVFLVLAVCMTIGLMTRASTVAVYACLISMHARNVFILNSGDALMRDTGFFLMFAPAGAAMSVDRLLRIWRGREEVEVRARSPWAQRMIQIQASVVYISAFWWKSLGKAWLDGTAAYYSVWPVEIARFPVPGLQNPLISRLATWGTLVIEFSAGVLVWFRDVRYFVLLAALGLHLSIEYAMNIPIFQWLMIATLVTFIYPEDLSRAWAWARERVAPRLGAQATVLYDGAAARSVQAANVLRVIDVFWKLRLVDVHSAEAKLIFPELAELPGRSRVLMKTLSGLRGGAAGLLSIAPLVPLLWPLAPLVLLQHNTRHAFGATPASR